MTRVVLVTGGTRGIGAAIAVRLQTAGYRVAVNFVRNRAGAESFTTQSRIPSYQWDVSDFAACQQGVEQVTEEVGPVDILVNNAGITRDVTLHRMQLEQWHDVIQTNLSAVFHMSRAVIEGMRARQFGRIVNVSSVNAQCGQVGQSNYTAAKAGMLGFTKSLALEGARRGITVNAVAPGYTDTEMVQAVNPEILKQIIARIPVGRLAQACEVAEVVLFLASEQAGYITGTTIDINGGLHLN